MVRTIIPVDSPEGILCGFGPLADPSKDDLVFYPPSLDVIILWFKCCGGDAHHLIDMRFVTDGMVDRVDVEERDAFVVMLTDDNCKEPLLVSVGKYDLAGIVQFHSSPKYPESLGPIVASVPMLRVELRMHLY
jgi:hypothetical protein